MRKTGEQQSNLYIYNYIYILYMISVVCNTYFILHLTWHDDDDDDDNDDEHLQTFFA